MTRSRAAQIDAVHAHAAYLELVSGLSSDDLQTAVLVKWPDANLADDLESSRNTSSLRLEHRSADDKKCWPLPWRSKRQSSTASSTCEIEITSFATSLKRGISYEGAPLGRHMRLRRLETNTQCLQTASSGYSAALRHLVRTERNSVGVQNYFLDKDRDQLVYQKTSFHKGDMFSKRLDSNAFERALK